MAGGHDNDNKTSSRKKGSGSSASSGPDHAATMRPNSNNNSNEGAAGKVIVPPTFGGTATNRIATPPTKDDATVVTAATTSSSSSSSAAAYQLNSSDMKFPPAVAATATSNKLPIVTPDRAMASGAPQQKQQQRSYARSKKKTASEWKEEGNQLFARKKFRQALEAYDMGLQWYDDDDSAGTGTSTSSPTLSPPSFSTKASILSNRAMTLLRLEDFEAAEESCSRLLDSSDNHTDVAVPRVHKVWYRRAVARENRAKAATEYETRQALILAAKSDLQASLQTLERDASITPKERQSTKQTVAEAAKRIQKLLLQQQQFQLQQKQLRQQEAANKSSSSGKRPSASRSSSSSSHGSSGGGTKKQSTTSRQQQEINVPVGLPAIKSQKQDLMRLFMSRKMGLKQQQVPLSSPSRAAHEGEAFFLVDWHWWGRFCRFVDLFPPQSPKTHSIVLSYLLPGATVPEDEAEADEQDKKKKLNKAPSPPPPPVQPGPIDNSSLFLLPHQLVDSEQQQQQPAKTTQQIFNEQWYNLHSCSSSNNRRRSSSAEGGPALKPNLVRGYHYELLPREVYHALREWYTEITPSICRRAVVWRRAAAAEQQTLMIALYPDLANNTSSSEHEEEEDDDDFVVINYCGACQAPLEGKLRCKRCLAVHYCDRTCQNSHWHIHKSTCREVKAQPPQPEQAIVGSTTSSSKGRVGLNNLGNTCFMNAALQCLSHATPLTRHFLSGQFKQDLNPSNPLGTGGKLAQAYESVLKDLWMRPNIRSASPNALKRAIALFAPRFAGCLQHDAQEFLAYLLDGLHEDLNRIRQAPYVTMPDVLDGQDHGIAGALAWDAHKRRNDSLVMDSFYGQFKSTCVCPTCRRVSVSFDAFNHVSLEIPQPQTALVTLSVCVVRTATPARPGSKPTRYVVQVRRNHAVSELKHELSKLTQIPVERLHLTECQDRDVCHIFRNDDSLATIPPNEALLVAYEADPYEGPTTQPFFHAILRHKVTENSRGQPEEHAFLGIPLIVSWPTSWTCQQIWDYLWLTVKDKVDPSVLEQYREATEFRLHDGNGKGVAVFPNYTGPQQDPDADRTSLLPRHYTAESLVSILGEAAVDNFLSMHVEWTHLEGSASRDASTAADEKTEADALDESRFLLVDNDASWVEYTAKRRKQQQQGNGVSLDQCLETFCKPERLDERNKWYCSHCKNHVRALKTMELWRLPNILVVHLKRFEFKNVLRRDKLDTLVHFPTDGLDMSAHCGNSGSGGDATGFVVDASVPAMYDLFAVVNHYGRMGFGHYTAFCRNWNERGMDDNDGWQLFDDSTVRPVGGSGEAVVSPAAYVLFYRRRTWN